MENVKGIMTYRPHIAEDAAGEVVSDISNIASYTMTIEKVSNSESAIILQVKNSDHNVYLSGEDKLGVKAVVNSKQLAEAIANFSDSHDEFVEPNVKLLQSRGSSSQNSGMKHLAHALALALLETDASIGPVDDIEKGKRPITLEDRNAAVKHVLESMDIDVSSVDVNDLIPRTERVHSGRHGGTVEPSPVVRRGV